MTRENEILFDILMAYRTQKDGPRIVTCYRDNGDGDICIKLMNNEEVRLPYSDQLYVILMDYMGCGNTYTIDTMETDSKTGVTSFTYRKNISPTTIVKVSDLDITGDLVSMLQAELATVTLHEGTRLVKIATSTGSTYYIKNCHPVLAMMLKDRCLKELHYSLDKVYYDVSKLQHELTITKINEEETFVPEGKKFDMEKPKWHLMLPLMPLIEETVQVLTYGAKKYDENNWMQVEPKERYYSALMRHLYAVMILKEERDSESGLSHWAHALCCLFFLAWKSRRYSTKNVEDSSTDPASLATEHDRE